MKRARGRLLVACLAVAAAAIAVAGGKRGKSRRDTDAGGRARVRAR